MNLWILNNIFFTNCTAALIFATTGHKIARFALVFNYRKNHIWWCFYTLAWLHSCHKNWEGILFLVSCDHTIQFTSDTFVCNDNLWKWIFIPGNPFRNGSKFRSKFVSAVRFHNFKLCFKLFQKHSSVKNPRTF